MVWQKSLISGADIDAPTLLPVTLLTHPTLRRLSRPRTIRCSGYDEVEHRHRKVLAAQSVIPGRRNHLQGCCPGSERDASQAGRLAVLP
jgi:hypothetical protein